MSGPTGFESMAGQLGGLQQQAQGLRAAVDSGQLVMDPEAAERVAKVYEEKSDDLQKLLMNADRLIANGAYGDCFIGKAMDRKFQQKVEHPQTGVIAMLQESQKILKAMAQAYRDSAREMQDADDENARNLKRNI